ncbi:proteasome component PUP2 [Fusarium circinatum]|uniref:Proteasome component PUP2 n=1 Tax=Fusarium circinatum TaxID=48490 RepID=A0A8H5TMX7_FUSCI|nr:proteasome component PUP2 [Fusarium circinatum]
MPNCGGETVAQQLQKAPAPNVRAHILTPIIHPSIDLLSPSAFPLSTPQQAIRLVIHEFNLSCRLGLFYLRTQSLHIPGNLPPSSSLAITTAHKPARCLWQDLNTAYRGINTFSPEGRLFQVEYSLEAIKLGSTAIGVATSEGVILGVEKRVTSTLLETSSVEKIVEIDRHIGCAMSGLQADARSMVEHARVESQSHAFNYNEPLRVESCTQAICDLALRFGEGADGEETIMSRPFGVALLIAGFDEDGPQLFHAEPSGTFYRYDAKAIGSGSEGAQAELQNEYHKSLTLTDAETLVLKTLKQVMEEKLDAKNVQLASVTKEKGFRIYTDEEMATVVERLPAN